MFFVSKYIFGSPQAKDDVAEVRWFDLKTINDNDIVSEHRPLLTMFLNWVAKNQNKWTTENIKVP
jgi:hypothetical protein